MTAVALQAVKLAIIYAEQYAQVLRPEVRRDIALGRVAMWARMQDAVPSATLAQNVIDMGDAIVAHYNKLHS